MGKTGLLFYPVIKKLFRKFLFLSFILAASTLAIKDAKAVCPVCTVVVCAGVGLSRWLGVDDLISGAWIGGLTVSIIIWTLGWLDKKQIQFRFRSASIYILFYLLILLPLYFSGIIGNASNKFLGTDRLLFGITVGSVVFLKAVWSHNFLKRKNQDKSFFPFQKVVIPVLSLIIISLIFYFGVCRK